MRRLAVIPTDPVDVYLASGYGAKWLKAYFNPANFFDEVYSLSPYERLEGDRVGLIPMPTPPELLHDQIRRLGIDVVRAYGGSHACELACADKVSGVPVIVSVHDTTPALLHDSIRDADAVLCVSEAVRRLAATKYGGERLWILPNRVDFEVMRLRERAEWADLDEKYPIPRRILHIGRKTEQKNLDNLIRALKILGPEYCILASGKGDAEPYRRLAEAEGVSQQCYFIEAIPNEELPRYFSWADCMCNPSRWEGMSIVLIEALAAGAILVTSDIPEIAESVHDGDNGLLIRDYENPAAIAAAIRRACTDQPLRRKLRENAPGSVRQFERSQVDQLEAGYYARVLDLGRRQFAVPPMRRALRGAKRTLRRVLPNGVKNALRPLFQNRRMPCL